MSVLKDISAWLMAALAPYGGFGLMVLAICDSSFLSLPEVNDALLMAFSIRDPDRVWEFAGLTTFGSVLGCLLLYTVGRKGGEALLMRRFAESRVVQIRNWYQRYGMLAVIVPSLLPPPLPFKIFVLCAGAFQVPWLRFITAVSIGRGLRYFAEGFLAVTYGEQAIQLVSDNFGRIGVGLAILIVTVAIVFAYKRRRN